MFPLLSRQDWSNSSFATLSISSLLQGENSLLNCSLPRGPAVMMKFPALPPGAQEESSSGSWVAPKLWPSSCMKVSWQDIATVRSGGNYVVLKMENKRRKKAVWPPCSTVVQFLAVCEGEVAPLVLEGDQSSVESYLRSRLLFYLTGSSPALLCSPPSPYSRGHRRHRSPRGPQSRQWECRPGPGPPVSCRSRCGPGSSCCGHQWRTC